MKKHKKRGYLLITFYLIFSITAGSWLFYRLMMTCGTGLPMDADFYISEPLKPYPDLVIEEEFEVFPEIEDEPIPDVLGERRAGILYLYAPRKHEPINLDEIKKAIGYPKAAREANIWGWVMMKVYFDKKGNYYTHEITHSSDIILTKAVEKEIKNLRYEIFKSGLEAKPFVVSIPFQFRMLK